ncbi:MAG: sigma factor [Nocardioides sp.]
MSDLDEPKVDLPTRRRGPDLASLLERSAGGDRQAFVTLYDATSSRSYGLAVRVLDDETLAADVTQAAYRQLWTQSGRFDPTRDSAISWILTMVHRRAVSAVRHVRSAGARILPKLAGTELTAMDALISTEREAVELAYFEGYTHSDVARVSGVTAGTAQSRIRDGLLTLRDGTPMREDA